MTRALTGLLIGLGLVCAQGARAATTDELLPSWVATPRFERVRAEGRYEGRILERMISVGGTSYSVGNVVALTIPKPPRFDARALSESVRVAMGFERWRARRQGEAWVFEAEWRPALRFVRLYVRENADSVSLSTAVFRMAYFDNLVLETELIQRRLAGVAEKKRAAARWLDRLFSWLDSHATLLPSAVAGGCPTCAPGDTLCLMTAATCTEQQMVSQMQQFNSNLGNTNTQLGQANQNWGTSNQQLQQANQNWAQTNQQISQANQQIAQANQNWTQTNKIGQQANQNWAQTNQQLQRANDLIQTALDPANAFLYAAAAGAGAAVGAMAISFAVDALAAGGKAIWEAITHEQEEARILERFRQAREIWEKTSNAAHDLEHAIDSLLYLRTIATEFGITREELIDKLGAKKAAEESALRREQRLLDEATESNEAACVAAHSREVSRLSDVVDSVAALRSKLKEAEGDAALCRDLKADLAKLLQAEGTLQKARAAILGGKKVWQKTWGDENTLARQQLAAARADAYDTKLLGISQANDLQNKGLAEQEALRRRFMGRCLDRDSNFLGHIPILGLPLREAWRPECSRKFDASAEGRRYHARVAEINKAHQDGLDEADREYKRAAGEADDVYLHNPTVVQDLKGYDMWFDQVRDEQACLHDPQYCPKDPEQDHGVMTRFKELAAKGKKIDEVCADEQTLERPGGKKPAATAPLALAN